MKSNVKCVTLLFKLTNIPCLLRKVSFIFYFIEKLKIVFHLKFQNLKEKPYCGTQKMQH